MRFLCLATFLAAACSDDSGNIDAGVTIDIDNGACGAQLRLTGEYVDWDSDTAFCGIGTATVSVEGGGTDFTAPNGRFDVCIPRMPSVRLTVTQPAGASQCASPQASYTVPVIFHANRDVILAGGFFSARAFTEARQATFFQAASLTFDPAKAHVFVHVNGPAKPVSLGASHDAAQAISATAWAAGDTGRAVFFPNVDVGTGSTTLSVAGGAIGTGEIPLVAGTITNASVLVP